MVDVLVATVPGFPIFCEKVDDELDVAVIDTPDIFALVPDAASPAIAFNIQALTE